MKYHIKINSINVVDEIKEYWTNKDYVQLLEKFNYPDAEDPNTENLRELLFMAISDYEPGEAAVIVLEYKLADHLTAGQIEQISNDMLIDTVCEEYPEMELQSTLFHINQLLFKAYNGKFPSASATIIDCSITPLDKNADVQLTKEMLLRLFNNGLSDRNIIKRLFEEQMNQRADFPEAKNIIWDLRTSDNINFKITTAENLLKKQEVAFTEFDGSVEDTVDNG
ncbi:MAG: hypothetical protein JJE07_04880 [Flavobacteriaceae bacterium]|nr:hypothetical protein [Flavobacteriaceae bacterium]